VLAHDEDDVICKDKIDKIFIRMQALLVQSVTIQLIYTLIIRTKNTNMNIMNTKTS